MPALQKLKEEGLLNKLEEKICIGQGYRGKSRIYIATDLGAFYYDILSQTWDKKPDNPYDINEIDMERLRADCFAMANVTTEREFAKYGR